MHPDIFCANRRRTVFFSLRLQPHQTTFFGSSIISITGSMPVASCDPSQNGCREELPHEHQA
jgi:hypothetical protein